MGILKVLNRRDRQITEENTERRLPDIDAGQSRIAMFVRSVHVPEDYGNAFKKGEMVVKIHLPSAKPNDVKALGSKLEQGIPLLKQKGIAGFFGDTPNSALVEHLLKKGAIEVKPPMAARNRAKTSYLLGIANKEFPKGYAWKPVRRVVFRFP